MSTELPTKVEAFFLGRPRFGSVRLRFGGGTVRAVPVFGSGGSSAKQGFSVFQYSLTGKEGSGSGFGSWKAVPAVPVPLSVSGKTVPTVPVPGSSHFHPSFSSYGRLDACLASIELMGERGYGEPLLRMGDPQ